MRPTWKWILLAMLLGLIIGLMVVGDGITKIIVAVVALMGLKGYHDGAVRLAAALGAVLAATATAIPLGKGLEGWTGEWFGLTGLTGRITAIGIAGLFVLVVVTIILRWLLGKLVPPESIAVGINKSIGAALGMVEGAVILAVGFWAVLALEPVAQSRLAEAPAAEIADDAEEASHPMARRLVDFAAALRGNVLGQMAEAANPLDQMRVVAIAEKWLRMANDREAVGRFHEQQVIGQLQQRPVVQRSLDRLAADPEIRAMIESGQPLTSRDLRKLLSNPTVLEILDDPDVIQELAPLADEIEHAIDEAIDPDAGRKGEW